MTEPTARDLLVCVEMNNARIRGPDGASARVLAAYREELLAASAQSAEPDESEFPLHSSAFIDESAEPQEAEDYSAIWEDIKQELNETNCSDIQFLRIKGKVDAIRARLASKPSREDALDGLPIPAARILDFAGMKVYVSPLLPDGVIITSRKELAERLARPSREEEMREPVRWFAGEMEKKLKANDHKGGWSSLWFDDLWELLGQELDELENAIAESDADDPVTNEELISECADIANFAMMIADNSRAARAQGGARDEGEEKR
jgi:hypothetical protein